LPAPDLALLTEAAREAGRIALGYFRRAPETWEKSAGAGPVTAADLAVDSMLHDRLLAARPGYGWLSEETEDNPARLTAERLFIVDPIDGTRAFIAGEPSWSHALAICEGGRITSGVVYLPARNLLYTAIAGQGAWLNGQPIRATSHDGSPGARVLTSQVNLKPERWPGGLPDVERHFRPSLAWRLALVGEGRFDAMLTLDPVWEWDIAAGALIAAEAGATLSDRTGAPARFNRPEARSPGLIAAPQGLHAALIARLGSG
jgi:myo-inositol-1(or 4)-monophosphatase